MIYCFHMPAFVFISGYFTYGHNENKAKLIQNTLIPFFICNTAFELIVSRSLRINIFTPVYIYWYLLSLFIWRCSIGCLKKVKGLLIIAVAMSLYIGLVSQADRFLAAQRTFAFSPFFVLGYIVSEKRICNQIKKIPIWLAVTLFCLFETTVLYCHLKGRIPVKTWENIQSYEASGVSNFSGVLIRCLALVIGTFIIICLFRISPNKKLLFTSLGMRTDCIFVLSGFTVKFVSTLIKRSFDYDKLSVQYVVIISLIETLIIVAFLGNKRVSRAYKNCISKIGGMFLK
jgi:fucose 4-O-acetylase-like acetyltransferase